MAITEIQAPESQPPGGTIREPILVRELRLQNLLSFGPNSEPLPLGALNVLIGANGSGKSNFIEGLSLLQAAPRDLARPVREGGGVLEWLHKGRGSQNASIDAVVDYLGKSRPLRHVIAFTEENQRFHLVDERIENEAPFSGKREAFFFYRWQGGNPVLSVNGKERVLKRESVEADQSILSQRRDPESYPEVSYLADTYERIRLYREWSFGRDTLFRRPQQADMRNDRLAEDFSNLGLFLARLRRTPNVKKELLAVLAELYASFSDFEVNVENGTVQVFFTEGEVSIPATRLSDGTLRFLCLAAILCDPTPPPLISIEEPELGLHPDILPKVADLLVSASERTQLIVTTHSDMLVDALTEHPETVVVCEKQDGATVLKRLQREELAHWLERYRLGDLWTSGELGGTRW